MRFSVRTHRRGGRAEQPLCERVAQHGDRIATLRPVLLGTENASGSCGHTQEVEVVGRNQKCGLLHRLSETGESHTGLCICGHSCEYLVLFANIDEIRIRHRRARKIRRGCACRVINRVEFQNTRRVLNGQRVQEDGVGESKNRRVGSNSQAQR